MSYCVNCGVEVIASEKACPLCGVEVQNPRQPFNEKSVRPYPSRLDPINERINRRFTAIIISICMAFPALLCATINFIQSGRLDWSLYVVGALALAWVAVVPYYMTVKPRFIVLFLLDTVALLLVLWLYEWIQGNATWYLTLALPLTLLSCGLILLNGLLIDFRVIRGSVILAIILISVGVLNGGIDMIIGRLFLGVFQLGWSFFVIIPCVAVAAVFLTIARRQAIREEIKRRLHV